MLISYKVSNFCSFKNEAEFDMQAPNNKVKNRFPDNYVVTDADYDVLKEAVIIGENAGGKTNFISSLAYLKSMFENNKTKRAYRALINANNLNTDAPEKSDTKQEFDICVIGRSGVIYHYNLQIDRICIVQESFGYKTKRGETEKKILFVEREKIEMQEDSTSVSVAYKIDPGDCNKEIGKLLEQAVSNQDDIGLFISKMAILGDTHALEFVNWMNNELIVESKNVNYAIYKDLRTEEDDLRIIADPRFLEILRMVDYSICNVEIDEEKPFRKSKIVRKKKNGEYLIRELRVDSGGVNEFFAWAVQIYRVVYENKVVLADEMDRVINPILAQRIISYINGKVHKGQFIFSSHNVLHLDLKNYMKEQIYFITKDKDTLDSELYSLADFPEIRYETTKIYEFYMKGILGGTAFE